MYVLLVTIATKFIKEEIVTDIVERFGDICVYYIGLLSIGCCMHYVVSRELLIYKNC